MRPHHLCLRVRDHMRLFLPAAWPTDVLFACTSNSINALSFSHDGEFIAIANAGNYIDIVSCLLLLAYVTGL